MGKLVKAFGVFHEKQVAKCNGGGIKNEDESSSCNFGGDIAIRAFRGEDGGAESSLRRVVADIRQTHFSLIFR